jgi:hypothetical protein
MLNKKIIALCVIIVSGGLILPGCYKNTTVLPETGAEITRTVSFSGDIMPVFNKSCNSSGCHNAGGKSPDLSAANAYSSLSAGGFINTGDAQSSGLYLWMTGKKGAPMPLSGPNKDYNALILAWIKQGALNN